MNKQTLTLKTQRWLRKMRYKVQVLLHGSYLLCKETFSYEPTGQKCMPGRSNALIFADGHEIRNKGQEWHMLGCTGDILHYFIQNKMHLGAKTIKATWSTEESTTRKTVTIEPCVTRNEVTIPTIQSFARVTIKNKDYAKPRATAIKGNTRRYHWLRTISWLQQWTSKGEENKIQSQTTSDQTSWKGKDFSYHRQPDQRLFKI